MTSPLDPISARNALAVAREQRSRAIRTSRPAWWVWLVAYLLLYLILLTHDVHPGPWLWSALVALLLLWRHLPRAWPALGAAWGTPIGLNQQAMPLRLRVIAFMLFMAVAAVAVLRVDYARLLRWADAPPWTVAHPYVALGPVVAAALVAMWFVADRLTRAWLLRGTSTHDTPRCGEP